MDNKITNDYFFFPHKYKMRISIHWFTKLQYAYAYFVITIYSEYVN